MKLSLLEGISALGAVIIAMKKFPGHPISVREDNIGLCYIMKKQSSRCKLTWCIAKAISDLGVTRRTRIRLTKVTRRTNTLDKVADELSKGEIDKAMGRMTLSPEMEVLPLEFWNWVQNPIVDPGLGQKIGLSL